ncbi:uncharacterized protein LOC135145693 isoform X1 [Zophobas morio]|uniref:uncharacterized protein LOC135145693 isoform X1 n=1 Tax=Zophobas morio TaxID=2755281 RepID=UPI003083BB68
MYEFYEGALKTKENFVEMFRQATLQDLGAETVVWLLSYFYQYSTFKPDSTVYGILIAYLSKTSHFSQVLYLLQVMKEKDIKMNEVLYTNAMVACLHGNNYEGALQLFEEARQCPDIQLNHFLYTNALVAFMRSGQYQKALDVYEQMKQNSLQINKVTASNVALAHARMGNWKAALNFLIECKSGNAFEVDEAFYNIAVHVCSIGKRSDYAKLLINQMEQKKITPTIITYTGLLQCFINENNFKASLKLFEAIEKSTQISLDVKFVNTFLEFCRHREYWKVSYDIFKRVLSRKPSCTPNIKQ